MQMTRSGNMEDEKTKNNKDTKENEWNALPGDSVMESADEQRMLGIPED